MSQTTLPASPGSDALLAHALRVSPPHRGVSSRRHLVLLAGLILSAVPAQAQDEDLEVLDTFTAVGRGESRATNAITQEDLETNLPGLSVEKALDAIPGVNVTTRDPFGFYESGNDIRVRAFTIEKLAVSIDDVPMGANDTRFGTPAGRLVDGENLTNIQVSQGVGDVTTPAYEALGGSIRYFTRLPSDEPGALLKYSIGDFEAERAFGRIDTGEILPNLTAYISGSKFSFLTIDIPDESRRINGEVKLHYKLPKGSLTFAVTYNDRDDFDTNTIQYDRWRALETGDPYAAYDLIAYRTGVTGSSSTTNPDTPTMAETILRTYAANGYIDYNPQDFPQLNVDTGSAFQRLGDLSDRGRKYGPPTYIDPTKNPGDVVNSRYYRLWRNGRQDTLYRLRFEYDVTEDLNTVVSPYFQNKNYYGLFPVSRADSRTQLVNAYRNGNTVTDPIQRTDIWAQLAYTVDGTTLVPIGTTGARPVGYVDSNSNGFFDRGETLVDSNPSQYSNAHAIIAPLSPTTNTLATAQSGIPGATGREEIFEGERYGIFNKWEYSLGDHTIVFGGWLEHDYQEAYRPTYNLDNGAINGAFLRDQVLFVNYDRELELDIWNFFVEDTWRIWDNFAVSGGFKAFSGTRKAEGQLDPTYWSAKGDARFDTRDVTYEDLFLPQLGVVYNLTPEIEVFANYAETLAVPSAGIITSASFSEALSPEQATNYDLGVRYTTSNLSVSGAVFLNKYEDRIVSIPLTAEELAARGLGGIAGFSEFRNVGAIESRGAEVSADWRTPIEGLRLVGSVALQESTFEDDLSVAYERIHGDPEDRFPGTEPPAAEYFSQFYRPVPNPTWTPTNGQSAYLSSIQLQDGNDQGNTPFLTVTLDARYTIHNFFINFGVKHFDEVYLNSLNTEVLPSYTVFNTTVQYDFKEGALEPLKASVQIQNLFDKEYFTARSYTGAFNGSVGADYGRNIVFIVEADF